MNDTMNVENGMQDAWAAGCNGYQPVFKDQTLAVECCEPQVSLDNLMLLLEAGLDPASYHANADRSILVEFKGGGSYLATGFSFGDEGPGTVAFADFLTAVLGECVEVPHFRHLAGLDFDGTLESDGQILV